MVKKEKEIKKRKSSSSESGSSSESEKVIVPQPKTPTPNKHNKSLENAGQSGITVKLQNAEMLAKYREKNPHLKIEKPTKTSNFLPSEIDDDDEVWLFEVPNSVDVNELVGKSVKLGSKSCFIKTENTPIECISERYDASEDNIQSIVFQGSNAQLTIKNVRPAGRIMLRTNIIKTLDEPVEFDESKYSKNVAFPEELKVRHPLHGFRFDERVNLSDEIRERLTKAQAESMSASASTSTITKKPKIKKERIEIEETLTAAESNAKKTKKRKADTQDDSTVEPKKLKKTVKTENANESDLAWINQI